MSPEEPWRLRFSATFLDQLDDRRFRARRSDIDKRLSLLRQDPYSAARAERLRHEFSGLRSARLFDAVRIIYRICEECRALGDERSAPLDCCADGHTEPRTLNILCLSDHYADMPVAFDFPN